MTLANSESKCVWRVQPPLFIEINHSRVWSVSCEPHTCDQSSIICPPLKWEWKCVRSDGVMMYGRLFNCVHALLVVCFDGYV